MSRNGLHSKQGRHANHEDDAAETGERKMGFFMSENLRVRMKNDNPEYPAVRCKSRAATPNKVKASISRMKQGGSTRLRETVCPKLRNAFPKTAKPFPQNSETFPRNYEVLFRGSPQKPLARFNTTGTISCPQQPPPHPTTPASTPRAGLQPN
jgi:hypothetical protein